MRAARELASQSMVWVAHGVPAPVDPRRGHDDERVEVAKHLLGVHRRP